MYKGKRTQRATENTMYKGRITHRWCESSHRTGAQVADVKCAGVHKLRKLGLN